MRDSSDRDTLAGKHGFKTKSTNHQTVRAIDAPVYANRETFDMPFIGVSYGVNMAELMTAIKRALHFEWHGSLRAILERVMQH